MSAATSRQAKGWNSGAGLFFSTRLDGLCSKVRTTKKKFLSAKWTCASWRKCGATGRFFATGGLTATAASPKDWRIELARCMNSLHYFTQLGLELALWS